jgi:hypothetical protein
MSEEVDSFVGGGGNVGEGKEIAGDLWDGGAGDEFVACGGSCQSLPNFAKTGIVSLWPL